MIVACICILFVFSVIYLYLIYRLNFWKRQNVPFIASSVYSSIKSLFYNPVSFFDHYVNVYDQLNRQKYGGSFWNFQPQFVVRDPELIKCILTKDFEYFRDRGNVIYDERDPLTNHLFSAPGDLWKALRVRLTPAFTSGKMKYMFNIVKERAEDCQNILENMGSEKLLNFKNISVDYSMDVINSTAFGWKTNYSTHSSNNVLRKISQTPIRGTLRFRLRLVFYTVFPFLKGFVDISMLPKFMRRFFYSIVRETVEYRKKTGYKRNDFLQLLMSVKELKFGEKKNQHKFELTDELMAAQCFIFFFGGFDTSSMVIAMTFLELAMNPDIQKTLQDEIDTFISQNGDQIQYDLIQNMPYLHKVIQETMRKYPLFPILSRICSKAYNIPGTSIVIGKGTEVIIPVSGMHRDAEIYPNPEVYDPERFNIQLIQKRHNYVYLPFGEGPRNCIGSRFALMTVKLGIIHVLKKFRLEKVPETIYPVQFLPNKLVTDCKFPVMLKCSIRY